MIFKLLVLKDKNQKLLEKKSNGVTTETPGESKFNRKFLFLRTFVFVYKMSKRQITVFGCNGKKLPGTSNKE